jgi:hypothetical protein
MPAGEEKVWETLATLDPEEVCRRSDAVYDYTSGLYTLKSFGRDFQVSPLEKKILPRSPDDEIFLRKLGYFFNLSVTGYLAIARDVALTGRLVNPVNMKSGQLFFRGSHVLPLDRVAEKYAGDSEGFLKRGMELGGQKLEHGDASVKLFPLPRVPVVQVLWVADDEFPARANLLFDSSCEIRLPIDVIWAIAMLSVLVML